MEDSFYCPFCAGQFRAEDVLFVDEDQTGRSSNEVDDPKHFDFLKRVISFTNVTGVNGEQIQMESRPTYKYHRWTKPQDETLPYQEPVQISRGNGLIPEDITVYRSKGLTPKQLTGEESAPWERITAEKEGIQAKPEKKQSAGEMLKQMMLNQQGTQNAAKTEQSIMPDDVTKVLTEKACPNCHCILPEMFGSVPTYRIAMLGGTASGKTTYMVAVANLLNHMSQLPAGVINACNISIESKRYFNYLIKCLENDKLASTPLEETSYIRFVFPIVMSMTTVSDDGNSERDFILIINDIPGEAMEDKSFLMSYPGLLSANAAIMLLDPFQFIGSGSRKTELIKKDLEMLGEDITETNIEDHRASFTPTTFDKTQTNIKSMLSNGKFSNLSSFIMVLNKLDLLYGGEKPYIDVEKDDTLRCINGQNDLEVQHHDGMDMGFIDDLSNQVVYLIENKLGYSTYHTALNSMNAYTTAPIKTLCISIRGWDAGAGEFRSERDSNNFMDSSEITGFRMLEPLLVSLAQLKLIRTKDPVESEMEEPEKPKMGFFRRLFRKGN